MCRLVYLIISICLFSFNALSQADTEFWFAAPAITAGHENKPITLRFSSYAKPTTINITQPANPQFVPINISLNANSATSVDLTAQIDLIENKPVQNVLNYGIKVVATAPVSAYYEVGQRLNPEIFPFKGRSGLGLSFLIPSQTRFDNRDLLNPLARNGFVIVATENNTTIKINLTSDDLAGNLPNVPYTIILQKGQTYAVASASHLASKHLGGSTIQADKPVAVTIYDDSVLLGTNYDLVGDQIVPEINTGTEFIVVRGALSFNSIPNTDFFYVWATENNTEIKVGGVIVATINRGQSFEGRLQTSSLYLETSKPSYVFQFTGIGQEVTGTSLPSIKCTGSSNVSFVRSTNEPFFLNILSKSSDIGSFLVNGVSGIITPNLFEDVIGTNGLWKAARISITNLPTINTFFPAGIGLQVSNTSGLFHIGFINGSQGVGTRIGYFSNYEFLDIDAEVLSNQCAGSDIQLMVANQSNTTYNWSGPNGFGSAVYNPVITNASPTNNGKYFVKVQVQGCGEFTDSLVVNIAAKPSAIFTKTNDTICFGSNVTLPITFTGKQPWTLVLNDGIKNDTIHNIVSNPYLHVVSPQNTTTYQIVTVIDSALCIAATPNSSSQNQSTILVQSLPTVTINALDTTCIGRIKKWQLNFTGKPPFAIEYDDGVQTIRINNITTATYSIELSPSVTTNYSITKVTDANGCTNNTVKTTRLTVLSKPSVSFAIPPEICLRDSIFLKNVFVNNVNPITNLFWSFGDNTFSNQDSVYKKYSNAGSFTVSLFAKNNLGCFSDTVSLTTVINPLPVSDFTFNASFYCEQRPVDFVSTSSSSVSTIQRWNWQMGDGRSIDTINGNQFSHTYAAYKSYTVGLMVENAKGCKSDTVKKVVTVYPLPQVGFIVPEICLADASAQFMDTSKIADGTENQFTYSWNLNASNITPTISNVSALNIKNPSAKYNKSDVYSIQSTVTSNRGCAVSKTQLFTVNGSIPVSKFSVLQPTMLCSNDTVRIQDISTVDFGNITRVEIYWDYINQPSVKEVDDNPTSKDGISGKIYSHQYSNFQQPPLSKTYQVRFVAYSGGNSCVSSSEQIITVHAAPQVRFTTLPGICNDTTSRMITQASEVSNISGSYAFSGVGVNSVGVFNPRAVASGTYPIQYKYTSVAGCSDSATQNITVWPSPTAKWGISDTTCERNSFRITDSSVANYSNINRWEWNYGNGSTSIKNSGQPYLYQYATANIYNVSLRVITDSGCRSTYNSQVVRIHPLPQISFTLPNICLPDGNGTFTSTSSIADNSDALFRYRWNFNDPNDATGGTSKIQQHRYTALAPTGGYAVQLKIESKDNCIDSLTQQFTKVYPQPKTAFDIRDTSVCMGDTIYFTDRTDGKSSTVQQWYWNLAQGNTARVQNPQRAFKDSGVYTISLYSYNGEGCVSDTVSQTVVVHPYPQLELGKNLFVLEGGTITLQPQFYYGKQLSYRWTPNLYLNSDTVLAPQSTPAIFLDSIIYKLTLTGIGGCAVSDSLVLTILHPPKVPNAFSPNGDGINDTWQIKYIDSYPGAEVSVFNRYGQMVYQVTGYRNSNGWNGNTKSGEALPVGTYYYIINPKNGRQPINGSVTIIR